MVAVDDALVVAAGDGYIGVFDLVSGAETKLVRQPMQAARVKSVKLWRVGRWAMALGQTFGGPRNWLLVVDSDAIDPVAFGRVTPRAIFDPDLATDGRLAWTEEEWTDDGFSYRMRTTRIADNAPTTEQADLFLAWWGKGSLVMSDYDAVRQPRASSGFRHFFNMAPAPNVMRRGRFSWVSGYAGFLRVSADDEPHMLFDFFGPAHAPRVAMIDPQRHVAKPDDTSVDDAPHSPDGVEVDSVKTSP